jgi:hypothetical protein
MFDGGMTPDRGPRFTAVNATAGPVHDPVTGPGRGWEHLNPARTLP